MNGLISSKIKDGGGTGPANLPELHLRGAGVRNRLRYGSILAQYKALMTIGSGALMTTWKGSGEQS